MSIDKEVKKALDSGKYFITVSYRDNSNKLRHFWVTKNYLLEHLMPTMEHIKKEIYKKEIEPKFTAPSLTDYVK